MKTSGRKLYLALVLTLLSVSVFAPCAEAGVLFNNRRNIIRTSQPRFQRQNYKVRSSTSVMKATSGRIFRARAYGGVADTMKLVRAQLKYEDKLAKYELKQFKANEKLEEKRRKIKIKESRQREKEFARLKKAKESSSKSLLAAVTGSGGQITNKPAARGALGTPVAKQTNPAQKKGFLASLWEALLGKRA